MVEGGGFDPGTVFRAEKPEEGATAGAVGAAKPEPELKQKELEKIKPEKEFPDKLQKEIEKIKPEKEFEKFPKEIEKIKPEKEFPEKFQVKPEFEKLSIETKLDPGTRLFKGAGTPEDRIRELEDAVEKLTHFIGVDLRPDLTTGALKGEGDVAGERARRPRLARSQPDLHRRGSGRREHERDAADGITGERVRDRGDRVAADAARAGTGGAARNRVRRGRGVASEERWQDQDEEGAHVPVVGRGVPQWRSPRTYDSRGAG